MASDAKVAKAKSQFIQLLKEMGADPTVADDDVRRMVESDEARERERGGKVLQFSAV